MTLDRFEQLIERQTELIAALDARDADSILAASAALSEAVDLLRADNKASNPAYLDHGLKLADAARIRVNYLTVWNRQKIDRLAQLRGQATGTTYTKPRVLGA